MVGGGFCLMKRTFLLKDELYKCITDNIIIILSNKRHEFFIYTINKEYEVATVYVNTQASMLSEGRPLKVVH